MAKLREINLTIFKGYPHLIDAHQYALDVVNLVIPAGAHVVNACRRQLDDLEAEGFKYVFDLEKANKPINFIEKLPYTKGKWAAKKGNTLTLQPWQKFIVMVIFGWVNSATGFRRFNEAYVAVPRKNGKSALAAAIALYMFAADGEYSAEVFCGATNEKQAFEVFKPARLICKKTPDLTEFYEIETNAKSLAIVDTGAKFEPVVGNPGDGSSPHLWIVDEYHEHPNSDQVDTAVSGMGSRDQPLLLVITTAGIDTSSACHDKQYDVEKILSGVYSTSDTERVFGIIYSADSTDDWTCLDTLIKANPNYGISVNQEYLETQLQAAIRKPSKQNTFKTKHLNLWVNSAESWLTEKAWSDCADFNLDENDFFADEMVGALDLASKRDITSFVRVYVRMIKGERHYFAFGHHFLPSARLEDSENFAYNKWAIEGYLSIAGDHETDLDEVEEVVRDFLGVGNCREIVYDPWKADLLVAHLSTEGVTTVEFRQNALMMSPAMDELEAAIYSGRLHHDGCPVLAWMAGNVIAKPYKTDYMTPTKNKPHNKIDGMVALIMAVGRAQHDGVDTNGNLHKHGIREL